MSMCEGENGYGDGELAISGGVGYQKETEACLSDSAPEETTDFIHVRKE